MLIEPTLVRELEQMSLCYTVNVVCSRVTEFDGGPRTQYVSSVAICDGSGLLV